jgi:hypothetical protein
MGEEDIEIIPSTGLKVVNDTEEKPYLILVFEEKGKIIALSVPMSALLKNLEELGFIKYNKKCDKEPWVV